MPRLPGMQGDVYFGGVDQPLPDWRATPPPDGENENDDDDAPADPGLIAILGLDPDELFAGDFVEDGFGVEQRNEADAATETSAAVLSGAADKIEPRAESATVSDDARRGDIGESGLKESGGKESKAERSPQRRTKPLFLAV